MAKKKSSKKRTTRRHRRGMAGMGAVSNTITQVLGIVGGVAVAGYATKLLLQNQSETMKALIPVGAGAAATMLSKNEISGDDLAVLGADDEAFAMAGDDEFAVAGDELSVLG